MTPQLFVPLLTYPDANSESIAGHVVSVAAELGGDLHSVAFNADIPDVRSALSPLLINVPELIREAEKESRRRGDTLLHALVEAAETGKITITTERKAAPIALLGEKAAEQARYFDLSLVGWEADNPTSKATAEAVVFGSGRPTMLLPDLSEVTTLERIAIAWDGSRVAARAVADVLSLTRRATKIFVLTVTDEKPLKEEEAGQRLAHSLRRRGFVTEARAVLAEDCPIADTLQDHAIGLDADLLVMGGYGHSRFREFVLGGATRGVLDDLRLPVMMSH